MEGTRYNTPDIAKTLHTELERRTRLNLHHHVLQKYKNDDVIPNGLRLKKNLCLPNNNQLLNTDWNQTLWDASCKLRNIAIDVAKEQCNLADSKIDRLKVHLWRNSSPQSYHRSLNSLNKQVMNLRNQLSTIKEKKLCKDKLLCEKDLTNLHRVSLPVQLNSPQTKTRNRKSKSRRFKRYKSKQLDKELYPNEPRLRTNRVCESSGSTGSDTPTTSNVKVVNQSNHVLSPDETTLLSRGLGFCPTAPQIDPLQLEKDLSQFNRRMRLKDHFSPTDPDVILSQEPDDYTPNPFKEKSTWTPKNCTPHLSVYHENVVKDIKKATTSKRKRDNLSSGERQALRQLRSNTNVVIKSADKGGAVVVMNRTDYVAKGESHLMDDSTYTLLKSDPVKKHIKQIQKAISDTNIDEETKQFLLSKPGTTPYMYFLPKIHKPNTPYRPIISGTTCPTVQISKLIDTYLRPIVAEQDSYLQDTTSFINFINEINTEHVPLPSNSMLVSADVSALYTNIPHADGLRACQIELDKRTNCNPPTSHLIRLLELVLKLNHFEFNGKFYLQIEGTAMGSPVAPSYANTFMGNLETQMLDNAQQRPLCWKRYIDDIFFIWTGDESELQEFQNHIDSFHPTIKFTFEQSVNQVPFLDVLVELDKNRIKTQLYSKPTDAHLYLLPTSSHPHHIFKSIPYSQTLRIRRVCSDEEVADTHLQHLKDQLITRGYPNDTVSEAIQRGKSVERSTLLQYKQKSAMKRVPLVLTYDSRLNQVSNTIRSHIPTLHSNERLKHIFPEPPIVAFRRNRNLKDLLVSAKLPPVKNNEEIEEPGFFQCKSKKCSVRNNITMGKKFSSSITKENFPITDHIDCKMSWLIYLITCSKCSMQYVGKTTTSLYTRFANHKTDIKYYGTDKGKKLPIGKHFNMTGHSFADFTIMGIELLKKRDERIILKRESFWIRKLHTLIPEGINVDE